MMKLAAILLSDWLKTMGEHLAESPAVFRDSHFRLVPPNDSEIELPARK
jgi:hypothetical protein